MESQPRALMRASCLIAASAGAAATPTIGLMADSSNSTHSGPVEFKPWYRFGTGGPVEEGILPYPLDAPAPFQVARWTVEPGTANDLDVHRSREVWIVIDGNAKAVWGDGHAMELAPGDVVAFESLTPHQLVNDGPISFVAASVF
jgi:mannose-6-phosphate isomerase-like protein (cupin superfamily)